jgi:hypothetical protein
MLSTPENMSNQIEYVCTLVNSYKYSEALLQIDEIMATFPEQDI